MLAPLYELRHDTVKGAGLFAVQPIPRGTIIHVPESTVMTYTREEFEALDLEQRDEALEYSFLLHDGVWEERDDGRFMNHHCDANVLADETLSFDVVVRDIDTGEEICCDYRQYDEVCVAGAMECLCGSEMCEGWINRNPPSALVLVMWHRRLERAVRELPHVPQPLREVLIEWKPELARVFELVPRADH